MPKHHDVIIAFGDIVNLWCNDNTTAEQHARLPVESTDEGGFPVYNRGCYVTLCVVSWPEHVLTPRYNCDCTIHPIDESEAIRLLSRGKADAHGGLDWKIQKHEQRHKVVANLESLIGGNEEPDWCDMIEAIEKVLKEFCGDYTTKE